MKKYKNFWLYAVWFCLYVFTVGLGSLAQRSTALSVILTLLSLVFFLPGVLLLVDAYRHNRKKTLRTIRIISLCSLLLTLSLIVLNILTVTAGEQVGQLMNDLLLVVSAPMFCSYIRGVSIFLWACLFVSSFPKMWKK